MPELISCPECKKHLQVPDELRGKKVQCPECKHTFTVDATDSADMKVQSSPIMSQSAPPKSPTWEKTNERGTRSQKKGRGEDDDEEDYDDDDDDRPRAPQRRSALNRGILEPHRGGMILAFGIISLVACFIFGPIAWVMGNADLREMREGRMDPEGEGLTQAGRILGMVASILSIVAIVGVCAFFVVFVASFRLPR